MTLMEKGLQSCRPFFKLTRKEGAQWNNGGHG